VVYSLGLQQSQASFEWLPGLLKVARTVCWKAWRVYFLVKEKL